MDRKILWDSNVFDEIESVYDKAQDNEQIAKLLGQLEENALAQARDNCGMITIGG